MLRSSWILFLALKIQLRQLIVATQFICSTLQFKCAKELHLIFENFLMQQWLCALALLADQMFVFFPNEPKINIKVIKGYLQRMELEGVSKGILVVQSGITPPAKQVFWLFVCNIYHQSIINVTALKSYSSELLCEKSSQLKTRLRAITFSPWQSSSVF